MVAAVVCVAYSVSSVHQDIRGLDKEMRAWDTFTGLDSMVKNMVTSLRAVGELQNPAIRDRHWEQLMQATQVCLCVRACVCAACVCVIFDCLCTYSRYCTTSYLIASALIQGIVLPHI